MTTIYFAGGCFWGTERFFQQITGVTNTEVGYANGFTQNPSYELVCKTETGYAETVKVEFDEEIIGLSYLITLFFMTIDPTSLNKQGGDIGTQYRTGIYYTCEDQKAIILDCFNELSKQYDKELVVECLPLETFVTAEDYHQNYLIENPTGYCHIPFGIYDIAKSAKDPSKVSS